MSPSVLGPVLPAAPPITVTIPAIGVDSSVIRLGLEPDGSIQVPSLDDPHSPVGWFQRSPSPGQLGPSIILGHIDSRAHGPGVFFRLGELRPGDTVDVTRTDGTVAVFEITGVRSYPKDQFPTLQVYGNLDHAGLRLITCGGAFDAGSGHYRDNIVAFASLVSSHQTGQSASGASDQ
jgi:sortase (surface protein transpeptidase)